MDTSHASTQAIMLAYAQAMFSAQCLEGDLIFLLTFVGQEAAATPEETVQRISGAQEQLCRLPLGQLRDRLCRVGDLNEREVERLMEAKEVRNRLAHRFLAEEYRRICDLTQHQALIEELRRSLRVIEDAIRMVAPRLNGVLEAFVQAAADRPDCAQVRSLAEAMLSRRQPEG